MNKNKIIFIIVWIIVIASLFYFFSILNSSKTKQTTESGSSNFSIWTYWLDKDKVSSIVDDFKSSNKDYQTKDVTVVNFSNYDDYKASLTTALLAWKWPDVFLLNNFEKSYLNDYILWINPENIKPNDFRKDFKTFFWDDLIQTQTGSDWKSVEFVSWIPVWYETLWIYYNRKFNIKSSDLSSWAAVNSLIDTLKQRFPDIVPIWVFNEKNNNITSDLLTQFFMLADDIPTNYKDLTDDSIKDAFSSYYSYIENTDSGTTANSDNYDNYSSDENYSSWWTNSITWTTTNNNQTTNDNSWKTNIELFSDWDEAMIIWYPSMINSLDDVWFNKNFLFAEPFPHYFDWKWKTLTRYSYFVVSKTTENEWFAFDFLSYLSTEEWEKAFLENFPYLLPASVSLEQDKLDEKIDSSFNLVLWDFYNESDSSLLSSFDKWIVNLYDNTLNNMQDDEINFLDDTKNLISTITCKYSKYVNLENLSDDCDKNN